MITVIWLVALVVVAIGAAVVYKSVGRKGQAVERQVDASTRNASVGRASGSGDD